MNAPREPGISAAIWLSAGPAIANGFGRLAYALILPAMRVDLGLTYTQAGALNSVNGLGYLAGSLLTFYVMTAVGARRMLIVGMYGTGVALALCGVTRSFETLAALRFAVGMSGAAAFIAGGALAASLNPHAPQRAIRAIAIYFTGGGIGIVLSGIGIPWLFALAGNEAWPTAWMAMGVVSLIVSTGCAIVVQDGTRRGVPVAAVAWKKRTFAPLLFSYFLFGVGYIAYMTFIIAWMRDHGSGPPDVAATWGALGLSTVFSARLWRHPLAAWPNGRPAAASIFTLTIGAALPLLSTALPMMLLSATLFGAALFIVPASMTAYVRRWLPRELWGRGVAGFTVIFATGQILGPVVIGRVSDATGSLFSGLVLSAAVLAVGAVIALRQRDPADSNSSGAIHFRTFGSEKA